MKPILLALVLGALSLVACDRNRVDTTRTTRGLVPASTQPGYQNEVASPADAGDAGSMEAGSVGGNAGWPTGGRGEGTGAAGQPANERH